MTQVKANWKGRSGQNYIYTVYSMNTSWNDVSGNYIFARRQGNYWVAVYIGQTSSFQNRLPNHNELNCAKQHGATHIHAHVNSNGEQARKAEETDLVLQNQPPCNDQLK